MSPLPHAHFRNCRVLGARVARLRFAVDKIVWHEHRSPRIFTGYEPHATGVANLAVHSTAVGDFADTYMVAPGGWIVHFLGCHSTMVYLNPSAARCYRDIVYGYRITPDAKIKKYADFDTELAHTITSVIRHTSVSEPLDLTAPGRSLPSTRLPARRLSPRQPRWKACSIAATRADASFGVTAQGAGTVAGSSLAEVHATPPWVSSFI